MSQRQALEFLYLVFTSGLMCTAFGEIKLNSSSNDCDLVCLPLEGDASLWELTTKVCPSTWLDVRPDLRKADQVMQLCRSATDWQTSHREDKRLVKLSFILQDLFCSSRSPSGPRPKAARDRSRFFLCRFSQNHDRKSYGENKCEIK